AAPLLGALHVISFALLALPAAGRYAVIISCFLIGTLAYFHICTSVVRRRLSFSTLFPKNIVKIQLFYYINYEFNYSNH
ncbi:MAG: hypothetical protein ACOYM7_06635, partial [Paludibacter sp.]